ncbi:MAG: PspC domain-containing protein [Chloroflexota bacterium]
MENKPKNSESKRLYKAAKRGEVAGISVGMADYFNVDVALIRILFVILALSAGPGLLAYLILWVALPEEKDIYPERYDGNTYLGW